MQFLLAKNTPRWIVLAIDIAICLCSLMAAYLLRFNFKIPEQEIATWHYTFPAVILVRLIIFLVFKTYAGIIRYTSTRDSLRILITLALGSAILAIINMISFWYTQKYVVPFSILIIDYFIAVFVMVAGRLAVKVTYHEITNPTSEKSKVIIYGAGQSGIITKRTLDRDAGSKYKVLAFVDDDKKKVGRKLEGIEITDAEGLKKMLSQHDVAHVIISIQNVSAKRKAEIIEASLQYNTSVLNVPPVGNWIKGELSFNQIKNVKVEDLLERDPIQLNLDELSLTLNKKTVLVTGAAGSIGSELVRQIIKFKPEKILLFDCAESPLYELELELQHATVACETIVGNIRNFNRVEKVFETFKPHIVFHAAAYKHVPLMENNASEAIRTNVIGTQIVANLSNQYHVHTFVLISTDKAVNPTNIMGASKRIAEMYVQSLATESKTKFITTRFGNVLGSNGSVIPIFKAQIESGKSITVTHPEITRYFMTIPEACQLVLQAASSGKTGEILVFDMGVPVKIADLAHKMVKLSGLTLGKDIEIVYTGLRPGEKLYEELLNDHENTNATQHKKIMIAKVKAPSHDYMQQQIEQLQLKLNQGINEPIVILMKSIVPDFKSNNSMYEKLDSQIEN